MRKLGTAVFGILCLTLLPAASALAQSNLPPPDAGAEVGAEVVTPPGAGAAGLGGTAFTGTDITVWMLVIVGLFVLGVGFLLAARHRAKRARI